MCYDWAPKKKPKISQKAHGKKMWGSLLVGLPKLIWTPRPTSLNWDTLWRTTWVFLSLLSSLLISTRKMRESGSVTAQEVPAKSRRRRRQTKGRRRRRRRRGRGGTFPVSSRQRSNSYYYDGPLAGEEREGNKDLGWRRGRTNFVSFFLSQVPRVALLGIPSDLTRDI